MDNENQNKNEHHDPEHEGDGAINQGQTPAEKQFTPAPTEMPEPTIEPKSSPVGPIVGIVVIVILIVLAGFYFWGSSLQNNANESGVVSEVVEEDLTNGAEEVIVTEEVPVEVGAPLSGSDEIEALESDLGSTDLDNLDAELEAIDAELTF